MDKETEFFLHFPIYQSGSDENLMGHHRIDGPIGHRAVWDNDQTVEADLFKGPNLPCLLFPMGIGVGGFTEASAQGFQPFRINFCGGPGKESRCFDHFHRHDPVRSFVKQGGAGKKHGLPSPGRQVNILIFFDGDIGQIPA